VLIAAARADAGRRQALLQETLSLVGQLDLDERAFLLAAIAQVNGSEPISVLDQILAAVGNVDPVFRVIVPASIIRADDGMRRVRDCLAAIDQFKLDSLSALTSRSIAARDVLADFLAPLDVDSTS
jgi:hypothetical protein